jgi:molecular chaperone GrpE
MEESQETSDFTPQQRLEQDSYATEASFFGVVQGQQMPAVPPQISSSEVTPAIQALLDEMERLRRDFEAKVKYDESKERIIESLHRELQVYREGLNFRILRPVFMDLIALHDDMDKLLEWMDNDTAFVSDQVMQHLKVFQETVEEVLRRNGVETFISDDEVFSPGKQRSLKTIPVPDPAFDKHIARRVRRGFAYEDKVLRHELVEVYKYTTILE